LPSTKGRAFPMPEPLGHYQSPAAGRDTWVGGIPVTAEAEAGGLHVVLQLTPGPYFLGELLVANISLRNDSNITYTLDRSLHSAVFVRMSGESGQQYVLPVATDNSHPSMWSTLAPGDTMRMHLFVPVSHTGTVTLQTSASFRQTLTAADGSKRSTRGPSPLDGQWPSIRMSVEAETPPDRQITLQREGNQVRISAPLAAQAHLYYLYTVRCHEGTGTLYTGNFWWEPLAATIVQEPRCGDHAGRVFEWSYAVSAPGYAIASGHTGS
jgi:hypothetical protein